MNRITDRIKSGRALFLHLLSVFFVLHGFTENYPIISLKDAGLLLFVYLIAGLLLYGLSWLILRIPVRAHLFATVLLAVQFFFGALIDFLRMHFPASLISSYTFILPFLFVWLIILLVLLRRSKRPFIRLKVYLTTLLLLLIAADLAQLGYKIANQRQLTSAQTVEIKVCDQCPKPDIYLILADGYPGLKSLKDNFNLDNMPFLDSLKKRGFHIVDSSHSNYNFTPFSVSSMLDMNFLTGIKGFNSDKDDMSVCYNIIKNSKTFRILSAYGYELYNYSIFDFTGQPSLAKPTFLPNRTSLITAQTFTARLTKEIGFHLVTTLRLERFIRFVRMQDLENNNRLMKETRSRVLTKSDKPRFVYTHLVMPHYPYYYDSSGQANPYTMLDDQYRTNKKAFISYLHYSNRQLLSLVDDIRKSALKPPVILLMSDHGFREFPEAVNPKYYFDNLNTVYLPDSNYQRFYSGMSNINQFSILFNTIFDQQLPLKKDSTSELKD
jgi:hypothetical protein